MLSTPGPSEAPQGVGRLMDQSSDAAEEGSQTEARSADHSARSAEKKFSLSFSVIRMGSRGTFVASFPGLPRFLFFGLRLV